MEKLWIIIKREYLTRVQKRSFILATLLTPLAMGVFFVVLGFIMSYEEKSETVIGVVDDSDILAINARSLDREGLFFRKIGTDLATARDKAVKDKTYDAILVLPRAERLTGKSLNFDFYAAKGSVGLDMRSRIESTVADRVQEYKVSQLGIDKAALDEATAIRVRLEPAPLDGTESDDESAITSAVGAGIGTIMGFIMYLAVFIYGMMVMRSVMEEKMSRIVEVMISSVRPFQLMLGKIVGVGAVGLTQVAIWAVLIPIIYAVVILAFGIDPNQMSQAQAGGMAAQVDQDEMQAMVASIMGEVGNLNWWMIVPLFVLYFLGGYFLYASLFAAVGSAMGDDLGEGQSLTLPITIPVIIAFYIMITVIRDPNSSLAVWSSLFPLFSPIVMPARLAFDPPWWQIAASVFLLLGTSIFFVWLSGRIYRVGILLYGKKVTLKELGRTAVFAPRNGPLGRRGEVFRKKIRVATTKAHLWRSISASNDVHTRIYFPTQHNTNTMSASANTTTLWAIDPSHSEISFKVRHLVISTVTGYFRQFEGSLESEGEDFEGASIRFSAQIDSIDTNNADRDGHLKSDDFFNAAEYPQLTFRSTAFTKVGEGRYKMLGELSIRNHTHSVSLDVEHAGIMQDPYGNTKAGFEINGSISRQAFGLKWNAVTEAGGVVVSDEVKLHLNVQLAKQ